MGCNCGKKGKLPQATPKRAFLKQATPKQPQQAKSQ